MSEFSTGSVELDALIEELRAGDNVVFYVDDDALYLPFIRALIHSPSAEPSSRIYLRAGGAYDALVTEVDGVEVLDMASLPAGAPLAGLYERLERMGPRALCFLEPLTAYTPWFGDEDGLRAFFLSLCPHLYRMGAVAYWALVIGTLSSATMAAIKDCTQVLARVSRLGEELVLTPIKVWGRYSEAMFRPHRLRFERDTLRVTPLPDSLLDATAYTAALADKNRELAKVRDALDRANRELQQRNHELATLNQRLEEQGRLYSALRRNLDHLLALLQAGQTIGSTLVAEQVRRAAVSAALRLFDAQACRLVLAAEMEGTGTEVDEGLTPALRKLLDSAQVRQARQRARDTLQPVLVGLADGDRGQEVGIAPVAARGCCVGTLEVCAPAWSLPEAEVATLLSYLASEASIALDNAHLYREVERQGEQLRSFVENVISTDEQENRRLALDLHDGLVQMIVAAYQHLQTAQGWRGRDPGREEQETSQGVDILRRSIYEARRLIGKLRPAGLDDLGLGHALRLLVAQLAAEAEWEVTLQIADDWPNLPPMLETAIYRIVQEATTNARKYARAPRVQVSLAVDGEALCLDIRDWGVGFSPTALEAEAHDPAAPPSPDEGLHLGLIGIRERARLWGGTCHIDSQPGEGTHIAVRIPRARALTEEVAAS